MCNYTRLNAAERLVIEIMAKEKKSLTLIADKLGRATSTISREIKRNRSNLS